MLFQQDGATAHTAHQSMPTVRNMFPGQLISRFGDVPWPHRSPDLSTCDFVSLGVFEITCLRSQSPYVEWFEGSHPSGNSSDRSSVVGPCHGRFKKKRLENHIQEDGRHLTLSFFKLIHLVWHVLSFNFVKINVNLLGKTEYCLF